jgi:hypothetical protein
VNGWYRIVEAPDGASDLDMLAPGLGEALEILMQQLAEVGHHPTRVIVVLAS